MTGDSQKLLDFIHHSSRVRSQLLSIDNEHLSDQREKKATHTEKDKQL